MKDLHTTAALVLEVLRLNAASPLNDPGAPFAVCIRMWGAGNPAAGEG